MITTFILTFLVLILSYSSGILSRLHGSANSSGIVDYLIALPYGLAGMMTANIFLSLSFIIPFTSILVPSALVGYSIAFGSALLGKRLGHGQYFDLATYLKNISSPEKIDFIVKLFFGEDKGNSFWRDFFGLTLTGIVIPLGLAILACMSGHVVWMFILLLSGALKSFSYTLPLEYPIVRTWMEKIGIEFESSTGHTEPGEWIFGWISGLGVYSYLAFLISGML